MAERYVRMNILSSGAEKAKATLDDLAERARKLGAESPDLKITADDTVATKKMKDLQLKIQILNRERAEVAFETKGDEKVKAKLLDISARLRKLDETVAKPELKLGDANRVEAQLIRVKLLMDSIHDKRVDLTLAENQKGNVFTRALGSLFGGGGGGGGVGAGGAGSPTSGILSSIGGASNAYTGAGIVGLLALLGSLVPALAPLAIGGGVGLGAAAGAGVLGEKATKQLQTLGKQLGSAKGDKRKAILAQMQSIRKGSAPELAVAGGFSDIGSAAKGIFTSALTSRAAAPGIAGLEGETQGPSFLSGLVPILKQIAGFTKTIGPQLGDMFRASLPFISMFAKVMEQLALMLMPAFTQVMKELTPYLPQIMQGFKTLSEGIADFIKDLGPGIKASVTVFKAVSEAIKGILIGLAKTFVFLADGFVHAGQQIKIGLHDTRDAFDTARHQIAAIWDWLWAHTTGAAIHGVAKVIGSVRGLVNSAVSMFNTLRHNAGTAWNGLWSGAISTLSRARNTAINAIHGLVSGIIRTIAQLPAALYKLGRNAISNLISGLRSQSVLGVLGNIAGAVTGFHLPHIALASGGMVTEPVFGFGARTGRSYSFAEYGPEFVSPTGRSVGGMGGSTYVINIAPTPLAHPADIGREVVGVIRQFEARSGKSWRS